MRGFFIQEIQFFDFEHLLVLLHNSIHAQNSKETNPKAEEIETVTVLKKTMNMNTFSIDPANR